jgi:hypothetical protein
MPDIDLEPRRHSSSYELKPMSRWWLTVPIGGIFLGAYVNGFSNPTTWALVFVGALLMAFLVLVFPHYWLSRRD